MANVEAFVREWCSSWNSHNLAAILSHYERGATLTSPLVQDLLSRRSSKIDGLVELSHFFNKLLARFPDLKMEPVHVFTGVSSVVVVYRFTPDMPDLVCEMVKIDPNSCKILKSVVHFKS